MPKQFLMTATHFAGGLNLAKGERNTDFPENVESQFMSYTPEGAAITALGWAQESGWTTVETGHGVDGLFVSQNYPDLVLKAVNGKVKLTSAVSTDYVNVDTGLSLTAGNPVLFKEYRGNIYFCNGVENMGRIAVGQLDTAVAAAATAWPLKDSDGYRFNNTTDKAYADGDEADYTAVSTDDLTTVTNGLAHAASTYVTQYNTLTAPSGGSLKAKTMAIFRDTLWYAGQPAEPNVLRFSATVSAVGTIANIHDFSGGENILIGEGGAITALHSTRDRLYVFTKDRVFYITTTLNSSGVEDFSTDKIFTPNYGCPNAFCVADMEDVTVFFTGRRLIRIGYQPNINQLLPDEKFDEEVYPILASCDADQSDARLFYNPSTKKLFLTIKVGGLRRTIVYDNRLDKFSYPWDHDASCYVQSRNATYFGDPDDDNVWRFGLDIDGGGTEIPHVLKTGRMDGGTRTTKRYVRGMVEGRMTRGTTISFTVYINGKAVGGTRMITDARADVTLGGTALGDVVVGGEVIGGSAAGVQFFNFRYPFVVSAIGEDIQFKWSSLSPGAFWQIEKAQIEGLTYDVSPYTHY